MKHFKIIKAWKLENLPEICKSGCLSKDCMEKSSKYCMVTTGITAWQRFDILLMSLLIWQAGARAHLFHVLGIW
jgi:hypothetical protein